MVSKVKNLIRRLQRRQRNLKRVIPATIYDDYSKGAIAGIEEAIGQIKVTFKKEEFIFPTENHFGHE